MAANLTLSCKSRSQLLLGCGATAIAVTLAMVPQTVAAQAFQATPTVVQGTVNIDRNTPGADLIEVTTPTAVIDWVPDQDASGNALEFLPAPAIASFFDAPGQGGFAVLNRILPSTNGNVVQLNGTVISSLQDTLPGTFTPGGFVAFYSPTGFLLGPTSVFDVGGLMLTTLEPALPSFDQFAAGAGPLILDAQPGSTAFIQMSPGAQIIGSPEDSFFIAAASSVGVFGDVAINGSHAYIAAEQASLTLNNGLFDIVIPVGTANPNAISLNGNIGGPSSTVAGDNHLIYAVAQAATNPIQMLFGGNLGFAPAATAGVVNGEVILSANYDVFGRSVNGGSTAAGNTALFGARSERSTVRADIFVTDASFSSSMLAISSHDTRFDVLGLPSTVDGNLQVVARQNASITVGNGNNLNVTGNVLVASDDAGVIGASLPDPTAINASAGSASLQSFVGSTVTINGDVAVSTIAIGGYDAGAQAGGSATGGSAVLGANGGILNILGTTTVTARASGLAIDPLLSAGAATGGGAQIFAAGGGSVTLTGDVLMQANAFAGTVTAGTSNGAPATGGQVQINVLNTGGTLNFDGAIDADASAIAGGGMGAGIGAPAVGGSVIMTTDAPSALIDVAGNVDFLVDAIAANNTGGIGGRGEAGNAFINALSGGAVSLASPAFFIANGFGGDGLAGGQGFGGTAGAFTNNGNISSLSDLRLNAIGRGGNGTAGAGGVGTGGRARMAANVGSISFAGVFDTFANGQGGDGTSGGNGLAGIAGAIARVGAVSIGQNASVTSRGIGGDANVGFGGTGGTGRGGNAFLQAEGTLTSNGSLSVGFAALVNAEGIGGAGGASDGSTIAGGRGGDGLGGDQSLPNAADPAFRSGAFALAQGDRGSLLLAQGVTLSAGGTGGEGGAGVGLLAGGDGGNGAGGLAQAGTFRGAGNGSVAAGLAQFNGPVSAQTNGVGGVGGLNSSFGIRTGNGGAGLGGLSYFTGRVATANAGVVELITNGTGGEGDVGGSGTGGAAGFLTNQGGTGNATSLSAIANGVGGASGQGVGGTGTGGEAFIGFQGGTTNITGDVEIIANGFGGASLSNNGGVGNGGSADIANFTPEIGTGTIGGAAIIAANGIGGSTFGTGFTGGAGNGGQSFLLTQVGGQMTLASAQVVASGLGGTGPSANGGTGTGGRAYIEAKDANSAITITNVPATGADPLTQSGLLAAIGFGGATTGGSGIGGTGIGGIADVLATSGGSVTLPATGGSFGTIRLLARGDGGTSSIDGGAGGDATGGTATINVDGGTMVSGPIQLSGFAQGGGSASTTSNISGGDAVGGQRRVIVQNGGTLTTSLASGIAGASGGNASGTGIGGDATGGTAVLEVLGGTANLAGNSLVIVQNQGGAGESGGNASGGEATVTVGGGGVINILSLVSPTTTSRVLRAGVVNVGGQANGGTGGNASTLSATFTMGTGTVAGGNLDLNSRSQGGASATGTAGSAASGSVSLVMNGGTMTLDNLLVTADATGGLSLSGTHGSALAGSASVALNLGTLGVTGIANVRAVGVAGTTAAASTGTGGNATGGEVSFTAEAISAGGSPTANLAKLDLNANADARDGGLASGGDAVLAARASGTNITAGELVISALGQTVGGASAQGGDITVAALQSAIIAAPLATLENSATGATTNTAGQVQMIAQSQGQVQYGRLDAESIGSNGGAPFLLNASGSGKIAISGNAIIAASGDVEINTATGGLVGGPTVTAPTAGIRIETPESIIVRGDNDAAIGFGGAGLTLISNELDILNGARIGATSISLTSADLDHAVVIGGTTEEVGYTLTQDEAARIEGTSIVFTAPVITGLAANEPDVLLRDLTMVGTLDDGVQSVFLSTPGHVRVEGEVIFQDAAETDSFAIGAVERLEVVTPGGIAVVDSAGNPAGSLVLSGGDVWIADADLIGQLQTDRNFAGRNDALKVASAGSNDPLGYIRGGSVLIEALNSILVQNTGTEDQRGGILVGSGTLLIRGSDQGASSITDPTPPVDVFAYGAKRNADGTLITGEAFYDLVNFERVGIDGPPSRYVDGSMFNDCDINTGECEGGDAALIEEIQEIVEATPPVNSPAVVEAATADPDPVPQSEEEASAEFGIDFPGLVEVNTATEEGTFDDGVMSGGDSSLYTVGEDEDAGDEEENEGGE